MPAQSKVCFIVLGLQEWTFETFFYSKNGHNSGENDHNSKKFTLLLKTIYEVFSYNIRSIQGFLPWVWPPGMPFSVAEGEKKKSATP